MSNYQNVRKAFAIEAKSKKKLLEINPKLNDEPGIYFLTREDENGFLFGYVGQARHVLGRLAQHLAGYSQHIDLSIKKHKLWSEENPHGWKINFLNFPESELDEKETYYIKKYAMAGYQMRNVQTGGKSRGRTVIGEGKSTKGYRQGVQHGKKTLARELSDIASKHLQIRLRPDKVNNKTSQKMFEKFQTLMDEKSYE
jgi:hypothetical protein